jgi:hypothetical protein
LGKPVEGLGVIALAEDTELISTDGDEIALPVEQPIRGYSWRKGKSEI